MCIECKSMVVTNAGHSPGFCATADGGLAKAGGAGKSVAYVRRVLHVTLNSGDSRVIAGSVPRIAHVAILTTSPRR
jgi:hypothetical protein